MSDSFIGLLVCRRLGRTVKLSACVLRNVLIQLAGRDSSVRPSRPRCLLLFQCQINYNGRVFKDFYALRRDLKPLCICVSFNLVNANPQALKIELSLIICVDHLRVA